MANGYLVHIHSQKANTMKIEKTKWIAGLATVLLLSSMVVSANYHIKNKSLKKQKEIEQLNSEKLLSEKLQLDKEIENLQKEIVKHIGKNADLDKFLKEANQKLANQEVKIHKLVQDNSQVKSLRKQLEEVNALKSEIQKQVTACTERIVYLQNENEDLQNSLNMLRAENSSLSYDLKMSKELQAMNFRVDVTKGRKDKLTVKARTAEKMSVSFEVSSTFFQTNPEQMLYLVISDPQNKIVRAADQVPVTFSLKESNNNIMASYAKKMTRNSNSGRYHFTIEPESRLQEGIYQIEVFTAERFIGSVEVRLRK